MSADIEAWPPTDDANAFESLCLDLWKEIWNDPGAQKNGRSGQPQAGVDVFGRRDGKQMGVQCKQRGGLLRTKVTTTELEQEVEQAKNFRPPLTTFILATTGPRDARVQERARVLSEEHKSKGLFSVEVWSWQDIWHELYQRRELFKRIGPIYWPRLAASNTVEANPSEIAEMGKKAARRTSSSFEVYVQVKVETAGPWPNWHLHAWLSNGGNATATDIQMLFEHESVGLSGFYYDGWEDGHAAVPQRRQIAKGPLHAEDRLYIANWLCGGCKFTEVDPDPHLTEYGGPDVEIRMKIFSRDQMPAIFHIRFSKSEIQQLVARTFRPVSGVYRA